MRHQIGRLGFIAIIIGSGAFCLPIQVPLSVADDLPSLPADAGTGEFDKDIERVIKKS